jgi:hypothetical protein
VLNDGKKIKWKKSVIMRSFSEIPTKSNVQSFNQQLFYFNKFNNLIPKEIKPEYKQSKSDFTRNRKLPFRKFLTLILSTVSGEKNMGVDTKSGIFFRNARRSGLWPSATAIHRSSLTKARRKVSWKCFNDIFYDAVKLAYELWLPSPQDIWHGMSVYAVDGSKYLLPATDAIRAEFDPESGLEYPGKGHFPQCLVSTVYDVFRRIPVARTIVGIPEASEREEAKKMLAHIPSWNLLMFDRGYPSYEFIRYLIENYCGYFLFRCNAFFSFLAIEEFIKSAKQDDIIFITPSNKYKNKLTAKQRKMLKPIKLRIIKLVSPDGEVSVLLTNLFDKKKFPKNEIINLYFRRWEVENHYRDEKVSLEIEKFHSKTPNGIRQELFAILIMTVIAKTLMMLTANIFKPSAFESQFKNAIMTLASDTPVLIAENPEKVLAVFSEIIAEISRVKYYRAKFPRLSLPRVTKKPQNKWCISKIQKTRSP